MVHLQPHLQPASSRTLITIDCNAPLTIDVLAKLMQAQSEFLLTAFTKQLAERDATIAQHTRVIDQLRAENTELRVELDDLQQYSRRNAVRISGIPQPDNEKPQDLQKAVVKLIKEDMKVELLDRDICRMHRVGRPTPPSDKHPNGLPRQIILKFTCYAVRRKVMKARRNLKDLSGHPYRIYINEDLTRKRAHLAQLARAAKVERKIKDTWVLDGKIFVILNDDVHQM